MESSVGILGNTFCNNNRMCDRHYKPSAFFKNCTNIRALFVDTTRYLHLCIFLMQISFKSMWTQITVVGYCLILDYFISIIYGYMIVLPGENFFNQILHSCHQKLLSSRPKSQCSRRKIFGQNCDLGWSLSLIQSHYVLMKYNITTKVCNR